jgi:hypothetical protein
VYRSRLPLECARLQRRGHGPYESFLVSHKRRRHNASKSCLAGSGAIGRILLVEGKQLPWMRQPLSNSLAEGSTKSLTPELGPRVPVKDRDARPPLWSEQSCHSDDLTKLSKPDRSLCSYRCATGENMNLIGSLALIAVSVGLLFFGRGRDGEGLPIFQKSPWIVETLFAVAILYLFLFGLMGIAINLNWLH